MTNEERIEKLIQHTKAEFLNEQIVKESDLETTQEQSYAKGWNDCNSRWIKTLRVELNENEDCRDCKKWDECPCGKEGHINGTSIGYSIGECKDYEPSITPQPKIDKIIKRIEQTRDKDKIAEYPYNRCIKIVKDVLEND